MNNVWQNVEWLNVNLAVYIVTTGDKGLNLGYIYQLF